jgi:hypothetical protein
MPWYSAGSTAFGCAVLIPVSVILLPSEYLPGTKLWAIARHGSDRAWFRWYPSHGAARIDAYEMRLAVVTEFSPGDRYSSSVMYDIVEQAEIDSVILASHWSASSIPNA